MGPTRSRATNSDSLRARAGNRSVTFCRPPVHGLDSCVDAGRSEYEPTGEPYTAEPGSLAEFLVDRQRRYTQTPDGTLRYTDVSHNPWPLRDVDVDIEENTLFEANGFEHPGTEPFCVYSRGVDVVTSRSKRY